MFDKFNINTELLTSSNKKNERERIIKELKEKKIDIIIGTQSLLNNEIVFDNIGMVVLDEQHKYGVGQRTNLIKKGKMIDILTLSATPIPRSMQLIAYGDIDYITIEKRYSNNINTFIIDKNKRNDMFYYIAEECKKGKQSYIIAPYVEDNEENDAVKTLYEECKKYISENKIAYLFGKMKDNVKEKILEKFHKNQLSVIISTTVVEVGIDVPNATIMAIMNAEKFGLASLHQLRGRIGRNGEKAYCFLYTEKEKNERLEQFRQCNNGFQIAEYDLKNRGSGDIFGLLQKGGQTLQGISLENIKKAKLITNELDILSLRKLLNIEIEKYKLKDVSFT